MKHILFVIIGVLLVNYIDDPFVTKLVFFVSYSAILIFCFKELNIRTLAIFLLSSKIIEVAAIHFAKTSDGGNFIINHQIFSTQIIVDLCLVLLVAYRAPICRTIADKFNKPINNERLYLSNADMSLVIVYILFVLADAAALYENILRNLEHVGFNEEFAKQYWHLNWVYHNYGEIKRPLIGLEFLMVWASCVDHMKNKYKPKKQTT